MPFADYQCLTPLRPKNPLNHTQLWTGILTDNCQNLPQNFPNPVVIKQLLPNFTALQFQQFYQEYTITDRLTQAWQRQELTQPNLTQTNSNQYVIPILASNFPQNLANCGATYHHFLQNAPSSPYFVMPFIVGENLQQVIAESPHFALQDKWRFSQKIGYFCQLCDAVTHLHEQGIIHCDIKPSNIMLTTGSNNLVLLDFGLARLANGCDGDVKYQISENFVGDFYQKNILTTPMTAGTPSYMSPEQITGQPLSYQTDYYNVGLILYEWLVGEPPFAVHTAAAWAMAHCQTPLPRLANLGSNSGLFKLNSTLNPEKIATLQYIFDHLLAKYPANRFADLAEVKALLRRLVDDF